MILIGFCLAGAPRAVAQPILSTWRGGWTSYRLIDDQGVDRTLLKAALTFPVPASGGMLLELRNASGQELAATPIPPGSKGVWSHGFWAATTSASTRRCELTLTKSGETIERAAVEIASAPDPAIATPLRLDRLNRGLLRRLEDRERAAVAPDRADVSAYLAQHDVIFRRPSPGWDEGLPLGNGDLGALVTGEPGKRQTFLLDKTDIWLATAEQKALGRSYVGALHLRYTGKEKEPFAQRLSLGTVGSSRVDLQACKLEYSIVSPK